MKWETNYANVILFFKKLICKLQQKNFFFVFYLVINNMLHNILQ
jgi:hypothetical protein